MRNEFGMEIPIEVEKKAKEYNCIKGVRYVYKDGLYGAKGFPASSIGGIKATRFSNIKNVNANKVYLVDDWVAFKSPTHGGVSMFDEKNTVTQNYELDEVHVAIPSNGKNTKNFNTRLKESAYENPWAVIAIVLTFILGLLKLS